MIGRQIMSTIILIYVENRLRVKLQFSHAALFLLKSTEDPAAFDHVRVEGHAKYVAKQRREEDSLPESAKSSRGEVSVFRKSNDSCQGRC